MKGSMFLYIESRFLKGDIRYIRETSKRYVLSLSQADSSSFMRFSKLFLYLNSMVLLN